MLGSHPQNLSVPKLDTRRVMTGVRLFQLSYFTVVQKLQTLNHVN